MTALLAERQQDAQHDVELENPVSWPRRSAGAISEM